jgi:hypothetical protein
MFNKILKISGAWWSILLGITAFFLITGGHILQPTNIDWLMKGDPATHWLGWQFFRYSPFFQWPIGANPDYGMDIGSSIVFTDSVPLLAFIFKPLTKILPDTFQYLGLWIFICFSLQSLFAWKLLSLFTQDKWLPLIGSVFFIIAPAMLWRLHGHYALFGQWVLLAGLYFYFARNFSIFRWIAILALTALIHAYLLAMLFAIWLADLIQRGWRKQCNKIKIVSYFLASIIILAIVMWSTGYFMLGSDTTASGFGLYRMNILSLIDPDDIWSKLLVDQYGKPGDHEGFNYLGIGMLGLGFIASYEYLKKPKTNYTVKIVPILIVSTGLFFYAISNNIAVGSHELLSYNLPSIALYFTGTFRVPGRFFWPVYYLIYLAIFYLILTRLKNSVAIMLCMMMLFIQIIDTKEALLKFRGKFSNSPSLLSPMRSPAWNDIAKQYKKIIFVLPRNQSNNWMPLSQFAAKHRMAINTGYFARVDHAKLQMARAYITTSIVNNELSPDSLYVFGDDTLWKLASSQALTNDIAGVLDGFRIIAPNFRKCSTCNLNAIASKPVESDHDSSARMEKLSFTSEGTGKKYQLYGWSTPEKWGTWTDGNVAFALLPLTNSPKKDLKLLIDGHAFLTDEHTSQEVDILVNNHTVATLKYDLQSTNKVRAVKISKTLALEKNGELLIKFNIKNPKSPLELGLSGDSRKLGLGIVSLELKME